MAWAYLNIRDPLVAWLVYRGEMASPRELHQSAMSVFHTRRLCGSASRSDLYATELAIETARARRFSDKASRLRGFYVFPDRVTAERGAGWGASFNPAFLTEVAVTEGSLISTYDANWITHELPNGPGDWIDRYLAGDPRDDEPLWEQVVDGRALVLGTDVRNWAHAVAEQEWPQSMGVLELGRLAVELDSRLGAITAFAMQTPGGIRVRYILNFADADEPDFLRRLAQHPGPKNDAALAQFASGEVHVPDLRSREFTIALP